MDRGWGLTLDNCDQSAGFFLNNNKPSSAGFCLTPRRPNISVNMFSMNNTGKDSPASSPSGDNRKAVPGELDFFASKPTNYDHHENSVNYPVMNSSSIVVKQEKSHGEASQMDVNVSLTNNYLIFFEPTPSDSVTAVSRDEIYCIFFPSKNRQGCIF